MLALVAAVMVFEACGFAQGYCQDGYGTTSCPLSKEVATAPIRPVFAATEWKTVGLDHITFEVPDYRKEAAFYVSLMGWTLREDDGNRAILDIGNWGTVVLQAAPARKSAAVTSFCFVIEPWNAKRVEAELRKRGLDPVAENDGKGFESFHVKDPDGWDLQISNDNGVSKERKAQARTQTPSSRITPTGWKTVWLDHLSFRVTNYKESASFYTNLMGWKPTYDEGSQQELLIGDVGDIIVRGGNANDPRFKSAGPRRAELDHVSFGIEPWDSDAVKAALEQRGLAARTDTARGGDIHSAKYRSYHTTTPNDYDLQISFVTREKRLTLEEAVKPR
ncbi:MAG TPA: VOC family protein [Candidatus Koribacter sp.]|jgi:catechol 2,3-dioxygenase-like lactoylglutathione lyase family enzyme